MQSSTCTRSAGRFQLGAVNFLAAVVAAMSVSNEARAHRVFALVECENGEIRGKTYFADGTPVQNARVQVLAGNGTVAAETKTNDQGEFVISALVPGKYELLVDAGLGHLVRQQITVDGRETTSTAPNQDQPMEGNFGTTKQESRNQPHDLDKLQAAEEAVPSGTGDDLLRELRCVRKDLEMIKTILYEEKLRTRIQDIVGAIGYIVGIMAVLYFLKARGRSDNKD